MDVRLTRDELGALVSAAEAAASRGGRDGALEGALGKVRAERWLRHEARAPEGERLQAADVAAALAEEGQRFPEDLAALHVRCVRDCHYDEDVEVEVLAVGRDGAVLARRLDGEGHRLVSESVVSVGSVGQELALSLLSRELLATLAGRGLPVVWNEGWVTEAEVDPLGPDPDGALLPEVR